MINYPEPAALVEVMDKIRRRLAASCKRSTVWVEDILSNERRQATNDEDEQNEM